MQSRISEASPPTQVCTVPLSAEVLLTLRAPAIFSTAAVDSTAIT